MTNENTSNVSETTTEITVNAEGQVMSVENTTNQVSKNRLQLLLDNIDTSSDIRRRLDSAQKKLVEVEASIVVLTQQLSEKADADSKLTKEVFDKVETLRQVGLDDDVIAIALMKQYNLSLPNHRPNAANGQEQGSAPNKPKNPEALAKKMGLNEKACEDILAFVATQSDGVGMKQIIEQFPEYVNGDASKLAGYVRSLAENGRLVKDGFKKGTKYFAKVS